MAARFGATERGLDIKSAAEKNAEAKTAIATRPNTRA